MLNEQQVVAIYMAKQALQAQSRDDVPETNKAQVIKGQSARVAVMYGVTPRAIRDIWNRQSWAYATKHLWCLEPQLSEETAISTHVVKVLLLPFLSCFLCNSDCAWMMLSV
jgi:hypothetical protein